MYTETEHISNFRSWFHSNGGSIHPAVRFRQEEFGLSVITADDIQEDTEVIACPFCLVITPDIARKGIKDALELAVVDDVPSKVWTETQLMCTYICLHWIVDGNLFPQSLRHKPYLDILPSPAQLRTPLHLNHEELALFSGSNMYSASLERRQTWQQHHLQCQAVVSSANPGWGESFTWERYLTAATYISSRAFPSTLMSPSPSLIATKESHPILLPGVDSLNHARAKPVSWMVSHFKDKNDIAASSSTSNISLILHTKTLAGSELLNNYGPKPNAELILGYGFTLQDNPDDTIVLQIGGATSNKDVQEKWEVGRGAQGIEPVWEYVLTAVHQEDEDEDEAEAEADEESGTVEDQLYASEMLANMAQALMNKLPVADVAAAGNVRPEVLTMLRHYVEGQHDILNSVIQFANDKHRRALQLAREQGIDILDDLEEENEL